MYQPYPENLTPVTVSATGRQTIVNCPSSTTGTVFVKSTSSLAFTVQGTMVKDSTTNSEWFYIGVTKQDGTATAAGSTITPTAADVYTFDVSRCVQFTINVSAGTGVVYLLAKGTGGAGGGTGSGGATASSSYAVQNVGTTGVSSGAGLSYASETLASGAQGTAFSSVSSFVPYPTRGYVFVTNPNTNCNIYLRPCPVGAGSTVSATAFLWIVPPLRSYLLPLGNALDLRWFSDIATGSATAVFAEAY